MRIIDADRVIRKYIDTDIEKFSNSDVKIVLENLKQNILRAPSIDIVRCGECKKLRDCRHDSWQKGVIDMGYVGWCEKTSRLGDVTYVKASDFCNSRLIPSFRVKQWLEHLESEHKQADTPQTERIKTPDYCDICNHKGCDNCIANNLDDYCVPSGYEPITKTETENSNLTFEKGDTPQTDCDTCRHYKLACELFSEVCKYEPIDKPHTERNE